MPQFRTATPNDTALILHFIKELAQYEKMLDQVVATEDTLRRSLFEQHQAEVIFVLHEGKEVGFALYFHNFSTFVGRVPDSIWKTSTSCPNTEASATAKGCSAAWRRSPSSATVAAWNGYVSTGTHPASASTVPSVPNPWTTGPSTVSPVLRSKPWPTAKNKRHNSS